MFKHVVVKISPVLPDVISWLV